MSDQDMAKLCTMTVGEVLKQLSLEGNRMEHSSASTSVKHFVPILKKDDLNKYMAWSGAIQGLILATDCSVAVDEKKRDYVLSTIKKHDDLLNLDLSNAEEAEILSIMAENDKVMGYINSGITFIEHRNCASGAKSLEFPYGIAYQALKELHEYFIPAGTMTKAGLKKILHQVNLKGDQDPKDLGWELTRIRYMFIEAGLAIDESDLVDQAIIALPGPDYADAMIAAHRNAAKPGEPTLKEIIQVARDKYEFSMKDHPKQEKNEVAGVGFKGKCHKCGEQGHKASDCPENGEGSSTIKGACHSPGKQGHKEKDCWEKEEKASKRPTGWVSCKKNTEANGSNKNEVGSMNIEFVL